MTPRITATIALRIIALLILIWALFDSTRGIFFLVSGHPAAHVANPIIAPSFDRTHSLPPAFAFPGPAFPLVVMRFVGGLALFFLAKPLGKLVAHGLE